MLHSVATVIAYLGMAVGTIGLVVGRFRFFGIRSRTTAFVVLVFAGLLLYFTRPYVPASVSQDRGGPPARQGSAQGLQVSVHFNDIPLYEGAILKDYAPAAPSGEVAEHEVYHIPGATLEQVSKWYRKAMPDYGWKLRNDTGTALFYEKSQREAFLGIDQLEGYVVLTILVNVPETNPSG